ncbi:MAG: aldo/keto reductase [Bacteroidia bacterium]
MIKEIKGIKVPALGFGTWTLAGDECADAVRDAINIGYRHIDTAQAYGNEEFVGKGIKDSGVERSELFITTKVWFTDLKPQSIRQKTNESLEKLQLDFIDLLLIHWPTAGMNLKEIIRTFNDLKKKQLVRSIGVSNFNMSLLEEAMKHGEIFCNQVEYHPFLNQTRLLEKAREMDMLVTAYSPLAKGNAVNNEKLQIIGKRYNKTAAQVILRWLLQQDKVAPIPRSSKHLHRQANFEIFDFELDENEMANVFSLDANDRQINPDWAPEWSA